MVVRPDNVSTAERTETGEQFNEEELRTGRRASRQIVAGRRCRLAAQQGMHGSRPAASRRERAWKRATSARACSTGAEQLCPASCWQGFRSLGGACARRAKDAAKAGGSAPTTTDTESRAQLKKTRMAAQIRRHGLAPANARCSGRQRCRRAVAPGGGLRSGALAERRRAWPSVVRFRRQGTASFAPTSAKTVLSGSWTSERRTRAEGLSASSRRDGPRVAVHTELAGREMRQSRAQKRALSV